MGKIRLKAVGDEALEQEQKEEQKKKRDEKQAKKAKVAGVGLGGGQRISTVGPSEEEVEKELEKPAATPGQSSPRLRSGQAEQAEDAGKKSKRQAVEKVRSKRYAENIAHVGKKTTYSLKNGIEALRKFKKGGFDETVELHINVSEKGTSGQVSLPHGTGKKLRIKIADPSTSSGQVDALIKQIETGSIDFDILVATPSAMPLLAKVARILGPRGLMPNPKNGTISDKPEQVVEKLSAGQVNFKTETEAPIIHMSVGKLSFEDAALEKNIQTVLAAIGASKIKTITLKSTMSPGIKINFQ